MKKRILTLCIGLIFLGSKHSFGMNQAAVDARKQFLKDALPVERLTVDEQIQWLKDYLAMFPNPINQEAVEQIIHEIMDN